MSNTERRTRNVGRIEEQCWAAPWHTYHAQASPAYHGGKQCCPVWRLCPGCYMASFGQKGVNYNLDAQGNVTTSGVPTPFTTAAAQPFIQIRNLSLNNSPSELKVRYPSYQTSNGRTIE